jgi:hypothetical protein
VGPRGQAVVRLPQTWPERRELNPYGRPCSPIPNRFTHYALRNDPGRNEHRMGFRLFRLLDRLKEQAKPMNPPAV